MEGGSVGFQIGGTEIDVILAIMNKRGVERLLSNQFTLGADASVAAGPIGRTAAAQTDAAMTAEILSWSRSRGVFAGVALEGATLRGDADANLDLYGKRLDTRAHRDRRHACPAGWPDADRSAVEILATRPAPVQRGRRARAGVLDPKSIL